MSEPLDTTRPRIQEAMALLTTARNLLEMEGAWDNLERLQDWSPAHYTAKVQIERDEALVARDFANHHSDNVEKQRDEARAMLNRAEAECVERGKDIATLQMAMDGMCSAERLQQARLEVEQAREARLRADDAADRANADADRYIDERDDARAEAARLREALDAAPRGIHSFAATLRDNERLREKLRQQQARELEGLQAGNKWLAEARQEADQWRACAEKLAACARGDAFGEAFTQALAEFDRLKGKEGA